MSKIFLSEVRGLLNNTVDNLSGNEGDLWVAELKKFLRKEPCWTPSVNGEMEVVAKAMKEFVASIDYSLSLEQMISAGKYDWKNNDITAKNFPISGIGVQDVTFELVHFDRTISTQDATKEILARGLEVAKIEHLLAFGEKYPDEQRKYPIVALGSFCLLEDDRYYPSLNHSDDERHLALPWYRSGWFDVCRFLAVRKSS